ncbi:ASCH domain-containing protein [Clostridioides difficile]|uniref:ASCH domain-containing protein n=1 Tax=Clostridioides difficile TaxID=1496 RepID=UPI0003B29092|nr:ASCH domain-containing protein [Clostridioides difficile]EGT3705296.1 ASCH domain-containing protein [Clostridioides difficile]EGT3942917.1 ASCH domain-containing protein [Clostridioides difficile]EGT3945895.1 ASCH domain-containing protein [Clostridioides difficile]EGT4098678.1 ASCH domain-containing protein [Clostridioides difficile]MBF8988785.1 ASCH domain-containing protein [Clostridioides difficile]
MKVLLSIKPEFVYEIINGTKKYEYRKSIFKREGISSIVVYATKPYGKIVGEFEIDNIIQDKPSNIWKQTKEFSGITKKFFNEYFNGKDTGFAIKIKDFIKYEVPLELNDFDKNIKVAPQSFCYLGED